MLAKSSNLPNYTYRAKTKKGELVSGTEFAEDEHQLAQSLRERGLILISVSPLLSKPKRKIFGGKVSIIDKLMFTRNLRVMINAGMPVNKILEILAGQVHSKKFAYIIRQINEKIKKGSGLAEAFSGWPSIFDEFYINMIKVGESGSNLDSVLISIEEQLRRDYELRSKIKSALLYPIVIVSVLVGIGSMIVFFIMPRLAKAFANLGKKTPFTLKMFIWLNDFLSKNWVWTLVGMIIFFGLFIFFLKSKLFKELRSKLIINLPIFGNISRQFNSARFLRTFSSLTEGGVPIYQALTVSANTLNNHFFCQSLKKAASEVQRGKFIHQSLDKEIWPTLVVEMALVGEETGKLSDILKQLANFYEEEVTNTVKNLASLIEPILMIIIGVAVGIFAISVIIPIYSITSTF